MNVRSIRYNPQLLLCCDWLVLKVFFPLTSNITSSDISSNICISDGLFQANVLGDYIKISLEYFSKYFPDAKFPIS